MKRFCGWKKDFFHPQINAVNLEKNKTTSFVT